MHIDFDELARYTQEERDKWRGWFVMHPEAMEIELQPGGRYPSVGSMIDHIFLVERRHLQRLRGATLDTRTGLSGLNASPLFDYGASVRRELEQFVSELDEDVANEPRTFTVQSGGDFVLTPRKLLFHCLLHETRHWAQIALSIRCAGLEPPGNHDLFYSKAFK
ncbi:MAG TPA: DinB family protein [Vicinamibacterales bacterium]|nr:DinB family protein [Vicinamibacterales bacterium]